MTIATLLLVLVAATPSGGSDDVTMLDFTATWCGPCKQMRPIVEQLADEGMPIKAVDIDRSQKMASRYSVESVPTFIVVDADGKELARTQGSQPKSELVRFYQKAKEKAARNVALASNRAGTGARTRRVPAVEVEEETASDDSGDPDASAGDDSDDEPTPTRYQNPKAWETVVRIRVLGNGSIGFGSGTIIDSNSEEALILTCAHVFKLDGLRQQPHPSRFPKKVMIDLFDGHLKGEKPAHVTFTEAMEGTVVDYDFTLDVALVKISPGRRIPHARVVPAHWTPAQRMSMLTVGCSEGRDASVWKTMILKPKMKGLSGNPNYEAIECTTAPKQGRSGGGLFTDDGYVAGVCNFAENHGNIGLYATPTSIYKILDRNKLMALYAPVRGGNARLVADNEGTPRARIRRGAEDDSAGLRGQSPEPDDIKETESELVMIPSPEMLKVKVPGDGNRRLNRKPAQVAASATGTNSWQKKSKGQTATPAPVPTKENLDESVEFDPFESFDDGKDDEGRGSKGSSGNKDSKSGDRLNWRSVK